MSDEARISVITTTVELGRCILTARLDDGSESEVFSYYVDELSFDVATLIGMTLAEARHLHFSRDRAYLRATPRPEGRARIRQSPHGPPPRPRGRG